MSASTPNGITSGERLGRTRDLVARWADYVTQPQVAEPDSSLAKDDALFDVLPPSHLAWQGILSAVDHLDSFFGLLDGGKSHPLAPGTLARAGVLGAAHALWLLDAPDRVGRQKRGLRLAHEEFKRDRQTMTDLLDLTGDPAGHVQQRIDTLKEWMDRAVTVGGTLGMTPAQVRHVEDTALIDEVAARYVGTDPGSEDLAKTYKVVWRMYSGTAHGLRWSAMLRADIVAKPDGTAHGYVTHDLEQLDMAANAVALFIGRAIDLYGIRRKPH